MIKNVTLGLTAVGLAAGVGFLTPPPAIAQAQKQSQSCQFYLNIPTFDLYPLIRRLRGDDDIDGNAATVNLESFLHQPPWGQGEKPNGLRLDITLTISEQGGDESIYQGAKSFWIKDKWITGGTDKEIQDCLINVFGQCVAIFAKTARTEAQLMAQCSKAAEWKVKDALKLKSGSNNRKWTGYESKVTKLIKSADCLADSNGPDAGNIGCKIITFHPNIKIDVNFGRNPVSR
ncbi:MAG: hypothetical protein HQ504_00320 [Rhodospirillaceae bacterium]|nr:hypothetical protein [Rhodospirillaceae bacterium]